MHIKQAVRRALASTAAVLALAGGAVAMTESPAMAAGTSCKTLYLQNNNPLDFAIRPHMSVGICYNGSSVWQSGGVTPGVDTWGYYVSGFDWYGTYGSGGWLGVGENFSATAWTNFATFYCTPRWASTPGEIRLAIAEAAEKRGGRNIAASPKKNVKWRWHESTDKKDGYIFSPEPGPSWRRIYIFKG